jgi:geranylgeranyl diphosphate synthase type I
VAPANLATAVEGTLINFLSSEVAALDTVDPALGGFARMLRDCVLAGGKRLRPTFAYWGWRGVAGSSLSVETVLPALAALELLHTFALVQDDVMDASTTRRGRPTAHRMLASQHSAAGRGGDAARFGEAGAVLIGDLCLVWADRLLATAALSSATLLEARRCYDQMRIEAIAGQYLDLLSATDTDNWSVERALRVARLKTASYTVLRPLLFGAALTDLASSQPVTAAYGRYGTAVGEAFQLCDDLLGVFGDPGTTGKPSGDDLRTRKPTVLLLIARQLATPTQRVELDHAGAATSAGNPGGDPGASTAGDIARLADIVAATGAVARVKEMIDERVAEALAALKTAPIDPTARDALAGLAVAATHRRA